MKHIQRIAKDFRNAWSAVDEMDLGDNLQLTVRTSRVSSGAVATTAQVGRVEGSFVSHVMYQDYHAALACSRPARVTKNAIVNQHTEVIARLADIRKTALAHYADELTPA